MSEKANYLRVEPMFDWRIIVFGEDATQGTIVLKRAPNESIALTMVSFSDHNLLESQIKSVAIHKLMTEMEWQGPQATKI